MQIVMKRTADLVPYARNPRKNDDSINGVAASIKEFGFKQPIVIDRDGVIVVGHTRAKAAQKLGLAEVPCVVADELTPEQVKAYRLLDNKLNEKADWEPELLALELSEITLDLEPFEVDFGEDVESDAAMRDVAEDEAPEPLPVATTQRGDVWILGEHRIMCGDSTSATDLDALIDGAELQMCFTDPPYGVAYEGGHFHSGDVTIKRSRERLANDGDSSIYRGFLPLALSLVDGPFYVFHAGTCPHDLYRAVEEGGAEIHALLIWHKTNATYAAMNAQYKQRHEPLLYFKPKGSTTRWKGPSDECTVWEEKRDARNEYHPTQKPVAVPARAIANHDAATVFDPFLGSGTTLIACEQLGRTCYGMEIEPRYVDVAVRRWQKLTGKDAIHEATGETFNQRESGNFSQSTIGAPNGG